MKKIVATLAVIAIFFFGAGAAFAAPFNAENNPQIVANYPTGDHGIPGEPFLHQGADVVMRAGQSGNFQQWFYGTSAEQAGLTEGDHSVWMNVGSSTSCPTSDFVLVPNAYPDWGDYLEPGANYCVLTNDFHSSEHHAL